jgi:hypothetical protein
MMEIPDGVDEGRRQSALGAAACSNSVREEGPLRFRCALRALLGCAWHTVVLIAHRRIHQPADNVGQLIHFADGTGAEVYRETTVERGPPIEPAVLVVCFRLRRIRRGWIHALFRLESELNTILFAGFPGLVSKLWLRHDEHEIYRGVYQWDGAELAVRYVRALWWVLAVVSEAGSIHYAVLPGLDRDAVLRDPALVDTVAARQDGWWRPTGQPVPPS